MEKIRGGGGVDGDDDFAEVFCEAKNAADDRDGSIN
jgi:hypothetical protein